MTLQMVLEIISLAAGVATSVLTGGAAQGAGIAQALVAIIQKAIAAHEAQTGQPIDPALLKPYQPL